MAEIRPDVHAIIHNLTGIPAIISAVIGHAMSKQLFTADPPGISVNDSLLITACDSYLRRGVGSYQHPENQLAEKEQADNATKKQKFK